MRSGRCDSSPTEPAASKPANDSNPNVDASASVDSPTPSGRFNTSAVRPWPAGASPAASLTTITAISPRINTIETASKPSSDRAAVRISRDAMNQISAQAPRASGNHAASPATPRLASSARVNTAAAEIDTAGNTRYVPSSAQPATNPVRGPSVCPTNAYTDPALA